MFKKINKRAMYLIQILSFLLLFTNLVSQPLTRSTSASDTLDKIENSYPFDLGEKLYYKMNYSIFTVGKAEIRIYPIEYTISQIDCYKIDVYGQTVGAGKLVSRVNDNFGAYINSDNLLPLKSWRILEEGKYRLKEYVNFDHDSGEVNVRKVDYETGRLEYIKVYKFEDPYTLDLISGFAFLRTIDFTNIRKGDTLKFNGFLEDTFYKLAVLYMGQEEIKTKLGSIRAHKLVPIMPDNKLFAGENSITAWIATDKSKVPLKIEAKMFIGKAGVEITGFDGMKYPPDFVN
jgi:hypothetical protein